MGVKSRDFVVRTGRKNWCKW